MTLLGNSVEMSRQEEHEPFRGNKRSKRSMRDRNQRLHHEGSGSRIASHAVHTPPIDTFFSLFTCPYRISQQSHLSRPAPMYRPGGNPLPTRMHVLKLMIGLRLLDDDGATGRYIGAGRGKPAPTVGCLSTNNSYTLFIRFRCIFLKIRI